MLQRFFVFCMAGLASMNLAAQSTQKTGPASGISRPKLVIGLVVDQMRWDFLYRYQDRYLPNGGFNRLLKQGFSNENTFIPYAPTITACGHSTIYTGSVPAITGIAGNAWYDQRQRRIMYCVEDATVQTVGSNSKAGLMSPRNMQTTTIGDELKLATNFRSKVIGIAIKDRGGILPAGHTADGAYWYDGSSGNWITSTYYRNDLPAWVKSFNDSKWVDKIYETGWNTLYPIETYVNSERADKPYKSKPLGAKAMAHPYDLKSMIGKNYGAIASTPYGNTMTLELAKAALKGEGLGKGAFTDMLAVSLSSPDYIGHAFGPNSVEIEDTYLRLDKELGEFFDFLDKEVGKGQYLFFISADHGVAHIPGFMKEHKIPAGIFDDGKYRDTLNAILKAKTGHPNMVISMYNYQIHLNRPVMDSLDLDRDEIVKTVVRFMEKQPEVMRVFDISELEETTIPEKIRAMITNGYDPSRGGDIQLVLYPQYIDGGAAGTTHGSWNPYDAHIPLVWYGWNIKPGKSNKEVYMSDIAPTIAALLHIQMPNGTVGKVIEAIAK